MEQWLNSPFFGIVVTLAAYDLACRIQQKCHFVLCHPLLLAVGMIMSLLLMSGLEVKQYEQGAAMIQMFLGPLGVVLAVPLYRHNQSLKQYGIPIFCGVLFGSLCAMLLVFFCGIWLRLDPIILASLFPKSVTTPIGITISGQLGGISSITIFAIIITGISGSLVSDIVFRLCHIHHPLAKGIALGTSAHAIGTAKAMEIGDTEGAMSSLAMTLSGIISVFLAPFLWQLLGFLSQNHFSIW